MERYSFLFFILLISATCRLHAQELTTQQYINNYKEIAEAEEIRTGVPAAISLAQGVLETNSGNGWLAQNANNHFGIKCKATWTGQTVSYDDDARGECFRKYNSPLDSWKDHSDFLRDNARYASLFGLKATDYKDWAYGLKKAGYATRKTYAQDLIKIIENYNLEQYTLIALNGKPPDNQLYAKNNKEDNTTTQIDSSDEAAYPLLAEKNKNYPPDQPFHINKKKVIFLPRRSSLLRVADEYNIPLRKIVDYNELESDAILTRGMLIYLERKDKTGADAQHVVQGGESMHDIAQEEGIRLNWLLKRNKMKEGDQADVGQQLVLQSYASASPKLIPGTADLNADTSTAPPTTFSPKKWVQDIKKQVQQVKIKKENQQGDEKQVNNQQVNKIENNHDANESANSEAAKASAYPVKEMSSYDFRKGDKLIHIVQAKETLYSLSGKYNVKVTELKEWNHLDSNDINIGQKLIVKQ